jgi:hypothetical protein
MPRNGLMTATRVRDWLSVRHSLRAEAVAVLALYGIYESSRGLAASNAGVAVRHAEDVVSLEQSLHVFVERSVQHGAQAVPGLVGTLGFAYLTLHLAVTSGLLVWLHRRRAAAFPLIRTTLLLASAIAVVGYVVFPTAPPRLTGIGIADTISGRHVDLDKGLISSLYNPFAAVPSMHIGYAVIVGASLLHYGKRRVVRAAGLVYPLFVLLVIVATGNHFLFDAAAGALVAVVALAGAVLLRGPRAELAATAAAPSSTGQSNLQRRYDRCAHSPSRSSAQPLTFASSPSPSQARASCSFASDPRRSTRSTRWSPAASSKGCSSTSSP